TAHELRNNDVIAFGAHGPTVSVTVGGMASVLPATGDARRATGERRDDARAAINAALVATLPSGSGAPRRNTAERVQIAVAEQTRLFRIALVVIVLVLGGTAAAIYVRSARQKAASQAEIAKLLEQNDAITKSFQEQLKGDTAFANR